MMTGSVRTVPSLSGNTLKNPKFFAGSAKLGRFGERPDRLQSLKLPALLRLKDLGVGLKGEEVHEAADDFLVLAAGFIRLNRKK